MSNLRHLVKRAQRGDADAFARIAFQFEAELFRIARAQMGNDNDANDVLQETLITCWTRLPQLRSTRSFKPWLLKILSNKCTDALRSRKRAPQLHEEIEDDAQNGAANDEHFQVEFADALSTLGEPYRQVAALRYLADASTQDIASALDISAQAVRKRLSRARQQLQAYFDEAHKKEGSA